MLFQKLGTPMRSWKARKLVLNIRLGTLSSTSSKPSETSESGSNCGPIYPRSEDVENLQSYRVRGFYPAHIHDKVTAGRYNKLGVGGWSTGLAGMGPSLQSLLQAEDSNFRWGPAAAQKLNFSYNLQATEAKATEHPWKELSSKALGHFHT